MGNRDHYWVDKVPEQEEQSLAKAAASYYKINFEYDFVIFFLM